MEIYHRGIVFWLCALWSLCSFATTYTGRVVDEQGAPIAYATVYPEIAPEWGTATNNDGYFSFEANLTKDSKIIFSYIGYEKKVLSAGTLSSVSPEDVGGSRRLILRKQLLYFSYVQMKFVG